MKASSSAWLIRRAPSDQNNEKHQYQINFNRYRETTPLEAREDRRMGWGNEEGWANEEGQQ